MIINHNIPALNAARHNQANNSALNKSIAKLSSGLKINSAADDAAGLAISEKMRVQIRGMEQAYQNSEDGISLLNTADGGMSGIQDVLHRMRELSIQAAHDTVTDDDRQKIQVEIDSLRNEINSIATDTEFNTIKLLCTSGTPSTPVAPIAPGTPGVSETTWRVPDGVGETYVFTIDFSNNTVTSTAIHASNSSALNNIIGVRLNGITNYNGTDVWASILVDASPEIDNAEISLGPPDINQYPTSLGSTNDTFMTWQFKVQTSPDVFEIVNLSDVNSITFFERTGEIYTTTISIIKDNSSTNEGFFINKGSFSNEGPLIIHVGANTNQQLLLTLPVDMRTDSLGLINGEPIVTSQSKANNSIMLIDIATAKVTAERAKVGALQNRLGYTMENLGKASENLSTAESNLRDLNITDQIKELTRQEILLQAS